MMKLLLLVLFCPILVACQVAVTELRPDAPQEPPPDALPLASFMVQFEQINPEQLLLMRESLLQQYQAQPDDWHRWQAAYALSRTPASPEQLAQSREILAGIPAGNRLAPMRDLLDGEIRKFMEFQQAASGKLELQAQNVELQARLTALNEQLDALQEQVDAVKEIEEEMEETQQLADEVPR
jgi:ATP-dependent Lon protease